MFWLLSHKHRILSLLILTEIMSMTSLINNIHLDISHKVIGINDKFGSRIADPSER